MSFSDYKGDAGSAGATGTSEVGEVASSQFDVGPGDRSVVSLDLAQAPDSIAPGIDVPSLQPDLAQTPDSFSLGSMDLATPQLDVVSFAPDLPPSGADLASSPDLVGQSSDLAQDLPSGGPDLMAPDAELAPDTAADVDAAPAILCGSGAPLFTDNFDQYPTVTAGGWTTMLMGGSAMVLDQSTFASSPASAVSSLPVNTQQGACVAQLTKSFSQTPHPPTAHLSFDVRIAKACLQSLPSGLFMGIGYMSPALSYLLDLYVEVGTPTTIFVSESPGSGVSYTDGGKQPIKLDEWQHIDLQTQFSGERPVGSLSVGDGPAQSFALHPTGSAIYGDSMASVSVGAMLIGPSLACTVNYDNVVFDMPPVCTN